MNNNVKKLELIVTKEQYTTEDNVVIDYPKYQLNINGTIIGIGINDKYKELVKYLINYDNIQVGNSVTLKVGE